jgi:AcrR family transcriptional regulator
MYRMIRPGRHPRYAGGVPDARDGQSAKDRLLLAATNLLAEGTDFSTRDVLAVAGVTAPTLYHHFGNKQGLVDAVARHGFAQYAPTAGDDADPVEAVREGWDQHVEYGLDHPLFYARLYGNIAPGVPCAVTGPALDMLVRALEPAAAQGRLTVEAQAAAARILAANVGVTLSLIGQDPEHRDQSLSTSVREAVLDSVLVHDDESTPSDRSLSAHAIALAASLSDDALPLSQGERAMLGELLARVADVDRPRT